MTRDVEELFGVILLTFAFIGGLLVGTSLVMAKRLNHVLRMAA